MIPKWFLVTAATSGVLILGCLGLNSEKACWLDRSADAATCVEHQYACYRDASPGGSIDADEWDDCNDEIELCSHDVDELLLLCSAEGGCLATRMACTEVCDTEACYQRCFDDFEACAGWYQHDCEVGCGDIAVTCHDEAWDSYDAGGREDLHGYLDDSEACALEYWEV